MEEKLRVVRVVTQPGDSISGKNVLVIDDTTGTEIADAQAFTFAISIDDAGAGRVLRLDFAKDVDNPPEFWEEVEVKSIHIG
jgi:hypothetical protein